MDDRSVFSLVLALDDPTSCLRGSAMRTIIALSLLTLAYNSTKPISAEPPPDNREKGKTAALAASYEPLKRMNHCFARLSPPAGARQILRVHAILDGKNGLRGRSLIRLTGDCKKYAADDPDIDGLRPGWVCTFDSYRIYTGAPLGYDLNSRFDPLVRTEGQSITLPRFVSRDIRGVIGAEGWVGKRPPPRLEGNRQFVVDDMSIAGPGQLRFSCPSDNRQCGRHLDEGLPHLLAQQ